MAAQNLWKVDIINKDEHNGFWNRIESLVHLIHVNTGLALKFSGRQLPDWGFNQHEVVADKVIHQDDTIWNVEEHRYTKSQLNFNSFNTFSVSLLCCSLSLLHFSR
jgi:dolichyl-phosphate-mannose-protein mannosyltransferase